MDKLTKTGALSNIGTFLLTVVILCFMVRSQTQPNPSPSIEGRSMTMGWIMPSILGVAILVSAALQFLSSRAIRDGHKQRGRGRKPVLNLKAGQVAILQTVRDRFDKLTFAQKWALKVVYDNPGMSLQNLYFALEKNLGFADVQSVVRGLLELTNFIESNTSHGVFPDASVASFVEQSLDERWIL